MTEKKDFQFNFHASYEKKIFMTSKFSEALILALPLPPLPRVSIQLGVNFSHIIGLDSFHIFTPAITTTTSCVRSNNFFSSPHPSRIKQDEEAREGISVIFRSCEVQMI
jgi:hypothetical protein